MSAAAGAALLLTLVVTTASVYIRLAQLEAGCSEARPCEVARASSPPGPGVSGARAIHRAAAAAIGVLVLAMAGLAWHQRAAPAICRAVVLAVLLTLHLAALGRFGASIHWSVVLGNVTGGMALAGVLAWLVARSRTNAGEPPGIRQWTLLAATLTGSTIALGLVPGAGKLHALAGIATALVLVAYAAHGPVQHRAPAVALMVLGMLQLGIGPALAAGHLPVALGVAHNIVAASMVIGLGALLAHGDGD